VKRLCIIVAAVLAPLVPAGGQMVGPPGPFEGFKSSDKTPVEIKADRMEVELASGRLLVKGHVRAKQGERVIYADSMEVDYTKQGKVTRLVASGSVKVVMGDVFVSAGRLKLDNSAKVIELYDSPRMVQKKRIITGQSMTYQIESDRFLVERPRIEWMPDEAERAEPQGPVKAEPEKQGPGSKGQGDETSERESDENGGLQ